MTLAPNERTRVRRTASRRADAELGERAHMLIWRAGRTQGSVAEALGLDSTALGKKLKGKNGWALQEVIDLAAELDTTVGFLFGETEDPRRPDEPSETRAPEVSEKITVRSLAYLPVKGLTFDPKLKETA